MHNDKKFMNLALSQANLAKEMGEVPVGAVITLNNQFVSSGYNQTINNNDPTAHAEIIAIREACINIDNHRLKDCHLYVTLEPCAMCFGAIVQARIKKVIFGAYDRKSGVCGSCFNLASTRCFNHSLELKHGILQRECSEILSNFFQARRN